MIFTYRYPQFPQITLVLKFPPQGEYKVNTMSSRFRLR
jgi:hypothetical protein